MRFQMKAFVSLLLSLGFLLLSLSGILIYLAPRGRVANWTGWTLLGLQKQDWQAIHMNVAVLFLILGGLHLYLNWPMFWGYIKKKGVMAANLKLEMAVALLIFAAVTTGTVFGLPPFGQLMTYNYRVKAHWDHWAEQAPSPHAEEMSLEQLAAACGLAVDDAIAALRSEGIAVKTPNATLSQLAEDNGVAPRALYAAISKHFPNVEQQFHRPGQGQGKGRRMREE